MLFKAQKNPETGEEYLSVTYKGEYVLLNRFVNKGVAFTTDERDELGLHGILPPAVCTMEEQIQRTYENYQTKTTNLGRYIYLAGLHDRNEILFFHLVQTHIDEMMPIIYTPVVGEACQRFSHIYRKPRGIYISYDQRDHIEELLLNALPNDPSIIVATDGERILGLGDQGAGGMGISIGKLSLYTLCAGIPPYKTLPIMLDVGTNNEELLADPLYLGIRRQRVTGKEYQDFIDKVIAAVKKVFPKILFQWEDFLKENALLQLNRFKDQLCSFNDDIQGTAGVALAGILGGLRISKQAVRDQRMLLAGAGAAGQGIASLFVSALIDSGLSPEEARSRIWMTDRHGLVLENRQGLSEFKKTYARPAGEAASFNAKDPANITLEEVIRTVKPTMLLGISGTPKIFSESVVHSMAEVNERPMIFPLSNPTSKSECSPEDAIRWSDGRAIVATGSPFPPVTHNGKTYRIGQCNNAYIFPGVGLGVIICKANRVTDSMFYAAAEALADTISENDLNECAVFPPLTSIRRCGHAVACAVIRQACAEGHADKAILDDLEKRVKEAMWRPEYLHVKFEP